MATGVLEDDIVSMVDVLHEDDMLEEEARAVLGGSDDKHCTYPQGSVPRQAIYACSTCGPLSSEPSGVCLACSLTCHDGHELFELYTKRNFCCDCGNSKFGEVKCKLYPDKEPANKKNSYNQNFRGVYCTCHRPYPDLEDEIEDEMIQCVICEDWYHSRHLGQLPPEGGDFQEMVCDGCMKKCPFLQAYLPLSAPSQTSLLGPSQQVISKEEKDVKVEVGDKPAAPDDAKEEKDCTSSSDVQTETSQTKSGGTSVKEECTQPQKAGNPETQEKPSEEKEVKEKSGASPAEKPKKRTLSGSDCKLLQLQANVCEIRDAASFWHTGWRSQLCKCPDCMELYRSLNVSFLTNESDSIVAYEERGQQNKESASSYESGMQMLQGLDRVQQVEAIHEYNDMKTELTDFFRGFAEQGKVVSAEDIKGFFDSMQSRKRQRTGTTSNMQYTCR